MHFDAFRLGHVRLENSEAEMRVARQAFNARIILILSVFYELPSNIFRVSSCSFFLLPSFVIDISNADVVQ